MSIIISSDRVYLREMTEEDWVDVHAYASQERVSLYQPWGPNSEDDTKAFVQQILEDARKENRTRYVLAIIHKEHDQLIGAGELTIKDEQNGSGEIGYIVHPDYWGQGYATEAAVLLLTFGFERCALHRIAATCDPRNSRSAKVLEKVGMTKEGRIRHHIKLKEGWRDSFLYSVLEDEWFTNQSSY